MVLAHARALLVGTAAPTAYVDADLRDTGKVLAEAARLLDFSEPVAVMLISVFHLIPDEDDPRANGRARLMEAVPSAALALSPAPISTQRVTEAANRFRAPGARRPRCAPRPGYPLFFDQAGTTWNPAWSSPR